MAFIVAYHTDDQIYRREAQRMLVSTKKLGLEVLVRQFPAGAWLDIVRQKVGFLKDCRTEQRGPILYVDVDAIFHRDPWPMLANVGADVSFAVLNDGKARSGTIFLADTPGAARFIEDWQHRLNSAPDAWDQHPLNDIASEAAQKKLGYSWANLPPELCFIFDRSNDIAGTMLDPVIEHLQASRDLTSPGSQKHQRRHARIAEIETMLDMGTSEHTSS